MKFYDTCSLIQLQKEVFEEEPFGISSITLSELEGIKTSIYKDEETKWAARQLLHLLAENEDKYITFIYKTSYDDVIKEYALPINEDSRIIATAFTQYQVNRDTEFYTADLSCYMIAKKIGLPAFYTADNLVQDPYCGFITIELDESGLADFYADTLPYNKNVFDLKINQYLLIKYNNEIIDKYVWKEFYEKVSFHKFDSKMFGKIFAKDIYQQLAFHSLENNQLTMLRGPAGTGKSYLAFGYMFDLLEQGKIDKIIVFCNTVATKGSAKLGFYPGSRTEKLLDSQIGNLLESKLGDRFVVEDLISKGQLVLLPMSDIRGYDTTGMNAAIYISEAQNLDIELMRLALQRIGEDSICIIDGDDQAQVDLSMYAGSHNGMKRVSEVFRGKHCYGEIALQNIYRSEIGRIAQEL